jgi:hypothetical protein
MDKVLAYMIKINLHNVIDIELMDIGVALLSSSPGKGSTDCSAQHHGNGYTFGSSKAIVSQVGTGCTAGMAAHTVQTSGMEGASRTSSGHVPGPKRSAQYLKQHGATTGCGEDPRRRRHSRQ